MVLLSIGFSCRAILNENEFINKQTSDTDPCVLPTLIMQCNYLQIFASLCPLFKCAATSSRLSEPFAAGVHDVDQIHMFATVRIY